MNILITGATGLVGSAVARRLIKEGHTVLALHRSNSDRSLLREVEKQVQWVEGDILDIYSLENAIREADYVVHAAAVVSFVPRDRDAMYKVNVEGTANVVNACQKIGTTKLCHISSVAALGRPDLRKVEAGHDIVITEDQRWEESPSNSHYAKTKYLAELEIWRGVAEGLNAVIVNPSLVLGEGDWDRSSTQIFRYVYDEKPFYTDGLMNYVDVVDVAEAVYRLLFSDITAERFILSAGSMTYQELFNQIADVFGKKRPGLRVSSSLTAVIWRFEALRSWLTGSPPLITRETAKSATHRFRYDGRKVQKAIGLTFRSYEETIRRVCESFGKGV
ncbi:SDR family NAD(P)-dependent oxidoreductase [Telluribacter sp.]|jgi:nucleoside-diphosphate-sugar epimerase|uniref:SDR family NAD(P)-dependent oxidoreductase n=1 Tax=Telluribacter sp. TaxID=1978767 RepID=UPI002E146F19|nr:SDR family NAD(P)-dependent oxidoreductase [Telluribacter sp.]